MFRIKETDDGTTCLYNVLTGELAGVIHTPKRQRKQIFCKSPVLNRESGEDPPRHHDLRKTLYVEDHSMLNRVLYPRMNIRNNVADTSQRDARNRCSYGQAPVRDCPCRAFQSDLDEDCIEKDTFLGLFDLRPTSEPPKPPKQDPRCFCGKRNPPGVDMAELRTYYHTMEFCSELGRWSMPKLRDKFPSVYDPHPPTSSNFLRYERCCQASGAPDVRYHVLRNHDVPIWYSRADDDSEDEDRYCHTYSFNKRQRRERCKIIATGLNRQSRMLKKMMRMLTVDLVRLTEQQIKSYTERRKPEPEVIVLSSEEEGEAKCGRDTERNLTCYSKPAPQSMKVWLLPDGMTVSTELQNGPAVETRRPSVPLDDISDRFQDTNMEEKLEPSPGDVAPQSFQKVVDFEKASECLGSETSTLPPNVRKLRKVLLYSGKTLPSHVENGGRGLDYVNNQRTRDTDSDTGNVPKRRGKWISIMPQSPKTNNPEVLPYDKMVNKYMVCADSRTFTPGKYLEPRLPSSPGNPQTQSTPPETPKKPPSAGSPYKWVTDRRVTRAKSAVSISPEVVIKVVPNENVFLDEDAEEITEESVSRRPSDGKRPLRDTIVTRGSLLTGETGNKCRLIFKCRGCGIEKTYLSKGQKQALEIVYSHVSAVHGGDEVIFNNSEKRFGDMITTVVEVTVKRKAVRKSQRVMESRNRS